MLNSFLKKYWVGLLLIAIFSVSSYFNLVYLINSHIYDSKNINISGKQRMLSLQIALLTTDYYTQWNVKYYNHGLELLKTFKENHDYLIKQKLTPELRELYFGKTNLDKLVRNYISNSSIFFTKLEETNYHYILNNSKQLLSHLDNAVNLFQKSGEKNRKNLINIASLILGITVIILLLEAKYIFIPIQKENQKYTKSLKMLNRFLEEKVKFKTEEITQLLESVGKYVIISKTNNRGLVTYCSEAFCEKIGLNRDKILDHEHPIFAANKIDKSELFTLKNKTLKKIIKNRTINGDNYWLDVKIKAILDIDSKIKEYLFVSKDITKEMKSKNDNLVLEDANKELEILASTCTLTGIYNRRIFEEMLVEDIALFQKYPIKKSSLIFMDIDHFKNVNDEYGHIKGDEVLVGFSKTVGLELRSSDIFARWGGEEFIILLKNTSLKIAEEKAEKLRIKIATKEIACVNITCSFGVVEIDKTSTMESIIKQADDMMYLAKEQGRNRVVSS